MSTTDLSDERGDPDDDEDGTAMEVREGVGRQVETASGQLTAENHHDERVEHERVVDGRHAAQRHRPTRRHPDQPLSFNERHTHHQGRIYLLGGPAHFGSLSGSM